MYGEQYKEYHPSDDINDRESAVQYLEGQQRAVESALERGEIDISDYLRNIEDVLQNCEEYVPTELREKIDVLVENMPINEMENLIGHVHQAIEDGNMSLANTFYERAKQSREEYYLEGRFSRDDEEHFDELLAGCKKRLSKGA